MAIVDGIANFIGTFFPVIVAGIVAATVGIAALGVKMLGLTNVLRAAAIGLGLTSPLTNLVGLGLGGREWSWHRNKNANNEVAKDAGIQW